MFPFLIIITTDQHLLNLNGILARTKITTIFLHTLEVNFNMFQYLPTTFDDDDDLAEEDEEGNELLAISEDGLFCGQIYSR